MNNYLKYSIIAVLFALLALTGCQQAELDTNQFSDGVALSAIAPNPVMRGGALRIIGSNLDRVKEVRFAGDVSVTEFESVTAGTPGELTVIVPLVGPEVGPVTIVDNNGNTYSTKTDLTFTEPIEIESFSPAEALSGDIITIKGEYLNDVQEVIFGGDVYVTEFESQSRSELKVKVPGSAITGKVILGDVNELEDATTIPNQIYTKTELVIGDPTVTVADSTTYKSGSVITVNGAHLDMIKTVNLPQASDVDFAVSKTADSLGFVLPASASDGKIVLVSYAGKEFIAGAIGTVTVADLTIKSIAEDGRYKAGTQVKIEGSDLDLVETVEFNGAEASWSISDGVITATIPAAAKDGAVTVTLGSGKQAYTESITVVKPVATAIDKSEVVAGADTIKVSGTDLDLVASVTVGDEANGLIECAFNIESAEAVIVSIPRNAYTGVLTLSAANGDATQTSSVTVSYDEAISLVFDQPGFQLGQNISFTGKNLMQIEQVFIKGKKVTNYAIRADDAMSFALPDKIGPGVYRIDLVLIDGTELTWPVPFEITAPYTEKTIWEGSEIINGWSGKSFGAEDAFQAAGIKESDVVRIYYTAPETAWWALQLCDGHWGKLLLAELNGGQEINQKDGFPGGSQTFSFNVTAEVLAQLTSIAGWGNAFIINGDGGVEITRISLIQFGAAEEAKSIWKGSFGIDWGGALGDDNKALAALAWGGYDWASVEAGTVLRLEFTPTADEVQIRVSNGSWAALPGTTDPYKLTDGKGILEVELTQAMLDELKSAGGLVITGQGLTLTEVSLVTTGAAVPAGKTIWEGSFGIDWGGALGDDNKALAALAWGGYDWKSVEAGTILRLEFTPTADEVQIRVSNGSWAALPGTTDPYKLTGVSEFELELTQAMLDELNSAGGLVLTGQGLTLTSVILK